MSFSLYEFRDLDLMLKLEHEGDQDGWVEGREIARTLGFEENGDLRPTGVGSRFAWMRRYGMLEYDTQRKMWRLSEAGRRVIAARLRAAHSKTIEQIPDESMIEVMSAVTSRYVHGSPMLAHMLRREFLYGTQPGRRR